MDEVWAGVTYVATLVRDEVVLYGLRYLLVGGLAMIGALLFGRNYKARIAALEAQLAELQQHPKTRTAAQLGGTTEDIRPAQDVPLTSPARPLKVPCPLTPKELVALAASRSTDLAREVVFASYYQTWLRVHGLVKDVKLLGGNIDVHIHWSDDVTVCFGMKEDLYTKEDFVGLEKGDLFTAEGRFDSATAYGWVYLRECERVN